MAYRPLNRDGRESSRNKSRPFRPPREVIKADGTLGLHPLDAMKFGFKEDGSPRFVNTTGCFGTVTTWGMSRISIVVRRGSSGKERGPRKKKRPSQLYCGMVAVDFKKASCAELLNLRNNILTAKWLGEFSNVNTISDSLDQIKDHLESYLSRTHPEEMRDARKVDHNRISSCRGMARSGKISVEQIKSIHQRVSRALYIMSKEQKNTFAQQAT